MGSAHECRPLFTKLTREQQIVSVSQGCRGFDLQFGTRSRYFDVISQSKLTTPTVRSE